MKKLLSIVALAGLLVACNDTSTDSTTNSDSATAPSVDTAAAIAPDTSASAASSDATLKDGLMKLENGKVVVVKNGAWEPLKETVTTSNGRKVSPEGEVSKGGKKRKLTEGMMIDKDGQMLDKDGKILDNSGWE